MDGEVFPKNKGQNDGTNDGKRKVAADGVAVDGDGFDDSTEAGHHQQVKNVGPDDITGGNIVYAL